MHGALFRLLTALLATSMALALIAAAPSRPATARAAVIQDPVQAPVVMQVADWIRLLPAPPTADDYAAPVGGPRVAWPLRGPITQPFGCTGYELEHPTTDCPNGFHTGLDVADPAGTPVRAAAAGMAYPLEDPARYGNHVIIQHVGGYATVYAHLTRFNVTWGQAVGAGDVIGFVGSTGNSSGPHLHFEVRFTSNALDPMPYLDGSAADPGPEPAGWPGAPRDDWRGIR